MKKIFFLLSLLLIFLVGCGQSAEPVSSFVSHISRAHLEGEDVYFEHNGVYDVAKEQKEVFENQKGTYMTIINMSDGSYIIQDNGKEQTEPDKAAMEQRVADKQKAAEEQAEKQQAAIDEKKQKEQEAIEFQREKQLKELDMEQQKLDDKQELKERLLDIKEKLVNAQIESSK